VGKGNKNKKKGKQTTAFVGKGLVKNMRHLGSQGEVHAGSRIRELWMGHTKIFFLA
jgi:hypothetical protein